MALRRREVQTLSASRPGVFVVLWNLAVLGLLVGFVGLILAASLVLGSQALMTTDAMKDFLRAYPGEYALPPGTEPGFPAWVQWQHFFNGVPDGADHPLRLQVRTEKRPTRSGRPRSKNAQAARSACTVVPPVAGHPVARQRRHLRGAAVRHRPVGAIVPTSWEVFPNAISAALQYASLDWPTENGWVNYNSLQQLAYFATVFIAAPLAVVTGVRMSGIWPKNATRL